MWEQGECWICVCVWVSVVCVVLWGSGYGAWNRAWIFLCRCQIQVSVYCARQIPMNIRCTQCSILLHLIDICFLPCICLWMISQLQTCLYVVVGPGFVSTLPAFMRSIASHSAGPHDQLPPQNGKSGLHCWARHVSTRFTQQLAKTVGCVVYS